MEKSRDTEKEDCPDCTPRAPGQPFTTTDYQRALDMLNEREDLSGEQYRMAKEWLDKQVIDDAPALQERDDSINM